jgi:2-dehydropantoate 2-reductase
MRVAVLGTGALGCVFAARLAAHAEVWVLGTWAEGVRAIRERGVRLHEPDGSATTAGVAGAATGPEGVPACDAALVLVKSYQTERAAAWVQPLLRSDGLAVSVQNGLDNAEKLVAAVGDGRAVAGVNYVGATNLGPGEARFIVSLTSYIGAPRRDPARAERLAELLTRAGLRTVVDDAIERRLWGKAVINAAINPLTALWRVSNGELLLGAERRSLLAALALEAAAVAQAKGIVLPFADPAAAVEDICRVSATNHSSMLQDIEHGRRTEIDSITGIIVAEGRRLGVPTPYNEAMLRLVRGLEAQGG